MGYPYDQFRTKEEEERRQVKKESKKEHEKIATIFIEILDDILQERSSLNKIGEKIYSLIREVK